MQSQMSKVDTERNMQRIRHRGWQLRVLIVLLFSAFSGGTGLAAEPDGGPNDREFATVVVGKDRAPDVERKLGDAPCLVPSERNETVSYFYNVPGAEGHHYYLRLEVNGKVDAITVAKDPPLTGVCYAPVRQTVAVRTGKGLQLGATTEEVIRLYGKPTENFSVGPIVRFRYLAVLDQQHEWDLVFRNGHLVEWTVVIHE